MYTIVDLETTGGSPTNSRITEVAIYKFDGNSIIEEYQTLVNPCRDIPYNITKLTGITDEMVEKAPMFKDIVEEIEAVTKDCIFVAHNANFDYGFLKAEYNRLGLSFKRKKLCTVRLSRQLLPGKYSYSLGRLCESEGIPLYDRHRAAGDAKATTLLFKKLLKVDNDSIIDNSLKPQSLEALIPPNVNKSDFMALPNTQGLYYFKDASHKIVYIGKAKNIKSRVKSHFGGNSNTSNKYHFVKNVYSIDFKEISSKLLLEIQEAIEIKQNWPRYNRALKRYSLNYGIFSYYDRNNYMRLSIGKCGKFDKPIFASNSSEEIRILLKDILIQYDLCPKLIGLQSTNGPCCYIEDYECRGACAGKEDFETYNDRLEIATQESIKARATYLIEEDLSSRDSKALILVEDGRFKAYGIVNRNINVESVEDAKNILDYAYDDQDLIGLLKATMRKNSFKISYFDTLNIAKNNG